MSARGNKHSKFKKGSGAFVCANCGKRTRDTGQSEGDLGFCKDCIRQMEDENARADGRDDAVTSKQLTVPALPQLPGVERELAFEEWSATMRDLFSFENRLDSARVKYQLIVGRAFAYGQERWKRGAEHEVTRIGFALGTLYNWSSVARRIAHGIERDSLTFEDYRALAKLESDEEREKWIGLKQAEGWSGKRLDVEIGKARGIGNGGRETAERETSNVMDESENETLEFDEPLPNSRTQTNKLVTLLKEWERAAETLQARGDEMSRAQADCFYECASQLERALGK